ncbi:hypothetical protein QAD02_021839 [Eretmocerus hayati]|uniref:Uncharacterized protein n=1 Tax=Eretmocerus hayati TaxID=131215 RepID=A0ACC2PRB0_9HYME|nr:hypothetical protein QAD02_021839 [Eretmocerus hayati]
MKCLQSAAPGIAVHRGTAVKKKSTLEENTEDSPAKLRFRSQLAGNKTLSTTECLSNAEILSSHTTNTNDQDYAIPNRRKEKFRKSCVIESKPTKGKTRSNGSVGNVSEDLGLDSKLIKNDDSNKNTDGFWSVVHNRKSRKKQMQKVEDKENIIVTYRPFENDIARRKKVM